MTLITHKQLFLDYLYRTKRPVWSHGCKGLEQELICLWKTSSRGTLYSERGSNPFYPEMHTAILCKQIEDKDSNYYYFRAVTLIWAHNIYSYVGLCFNMMGLCSIVQLLS